MTGRESMVGFGTKQAWLAVRNTPAARIRDALGLRDLGPLAWRPGVDLAYFTDDRVVLTPPLPGHGADWTLVVGRWLLSDKSTVDIFDLSSRLETEVQYYASHRGFERHQWRRARRGELVRSFGYQAEFGVTDWRGDPDEAELAAHLPPTLGQDDGAEDDEPSVLVGEADVMSVAGAWSLNPTTLDGQPAPGPLTAAAA